MVVADHESRIFLGFFRKHDGTEYALVQYRLPLVKRMHKSRLGSFESFFKYFLGSLESVQILSGII